MFDIENQKMLSLRQRTLILMEGSVLGKKYMNMGHMDEALDYMTGLKETCYSYGGTFTLLWHNSSLRTEEDKALYQALLQ